MGLSETPLLVPVTRFVSASISPRIFAKSENRCPGMCRNSPHSSGCPTLRHTTSGAKAHRRFQQPLLPARASPPGNTRSGDQGRVGGLPRGGGDALLTWGAS